MGRPLLIIVAGLFVAFSYVFLGMNSRKLSMNKQNVKTHDAIKAKNSAHTGIQIAIQKFNESNETWTGPETVNYEDSELTISLNEVKPDTIRVTSKSNYYEAEHTVISTFYIGQKQPLVPEFVGALTIASGNFTLNTGNKKVHFDGHDKSGACSDKPGVTVPTNAGVTQVGNDGGIDGNPSNVAVKDNSIDFDEVGKLIEALEPGAKHISGNYKGNLGTATEPGVFFVDSYTKLTGGIEPGHGILVIRSGGKLDLEGELSVAGNFEFNGLVVFENAYNFTGRGTPDINGTIIAGSSNNNTTLHIDVNGEINVQYDCKAKEYADDAVNNLLNTTLYQQLSIYE